MHEKLPSMQRVKSTNCKVNLRLIVGDCMNTCNLTHAILYVGLYHLLSRHCIGQLYTIRCLLSDILGMVWKQ